MSLTKQNWFKPVMHQPLPTHSPPAGYHAETRVYSMTIMITVPVPTANVLFAPPVVHLHVEYGIFCSLIIRFL